MFFIGMIFDEFEYFEMALEIQFDVLMVDKCIDRYKIEYIFAKDVAKNVLK